MKKWLTDILSGYFHFNRQERNGVFVLACIICLALLARIALPYLLADRPAVQFANIDFSKFTDSMPAPGGPVASNGSHTGAYQQVASEEADKFVFDPNTISAGEAMKLGFSGKMAKTLVNYRSKGGKFYKPEDLQKLYGMTPVLYRALEPYILIANTKPYKKDSLPGPYAKPSTARKNYQVELNGADSLSIVMLKGIGPSLTRRIIKYRSMLGGFYSVEQLKEVYGMPDSTIGQVAGHITVDASLITKLLVNQAGFNELRRHPYLTFQSTQALINYRTKHGRLSEESLRTIGVFDEAQLRRLLPYLDFK